MNHTSHVPILETESGTGGRRRKRQFGSRTILAASCVFISLLAESHAADGEYEFRFDPPDGMTIDRRMATKITEYQVFNPDVALFEGMTVRYGPKAGTGESKWSSDCFRDVSRSAGKRIREKMTGVVKIVIPQEGGQATYLRPPGERKWKLKHRSEGTIHAVGSGYIFTYVPIKLDMREAPPTRGAAVDLAVKWDEVTYTFDSLGGIVDFSRTDAKPEDLPSWAREEAETPFLHLYDDVIQDELGAMWNSRCGQWLGRTVSVGDLFASIDTVVVAAPEIMEMTVFSLYRIEEAKRCGKSTCLRIGHFYDTAPNEIESAAGASFWDAYEGDYMPGEPPEQYVLLGHTEVIIDPATLLIHKEKSMRRLSFLKPYTGHPEVFDQDLIHVVDERTEVKYKYSK